MVKILTLRANIVKPKQTVIFKVKIVKKPQI